MASKVPGFGGESCLFLRIEAEPLSQVSYWKPANQCFCFLCIVNFNCSLLENFRCLYSIFWSYWLPPSPTPPRSPKLSLTPPNSLHVFSESSAWVTGCLAAPSSMAVPCRVAVRTFPQHDKIASPTYCPHVSFTIGFDHSVGFSFINKNCNLLASLIMEWHEYKVVTKAGRELRR